MKIPMVTLAAFMALVPLISSAESDFGLCMIEGVPVGTLEDNPEVIKGTRKGETIDCSGSHRVGGHEIYGYGGDDTLIGSKYDDFIAGGGGNDVIFGGVGSSPASGVACELHAAAAGSSYLTKGGSGDDIIYGGDGNDCINAGSGEDFVYGEGGDDTIFGGNHSDVLYGGPGNDYIDGGWHTDTCTGGAGIDVIDCEIIN